MGYWARAIRPRIILWHDGHASSCLVTFLLEPQPADCRALYEGSTRQYGRCFCTSPSADLEQYVKPVFDSLCEEKLLKRCLLGATQNQNESFNNTIWTRAPKTEYVSRPTIEIAVAQAVLVFNSGSQALLPILVKMSTL